MSDADLALAKKNKVALVSTDFTGTDVMVDVKGETRGTLAIEYVDSFVEAGLPPRDVLKAMSFVMRNGAIVRQ